MKLIHKEKGVVKLRIQNQNDLWYLSHIIEENDLVSGKTQRKIKIGAEGDRNTKTVTKKIFLKIMVERVEFHKYSDSLRVSGKIVDGPEEVARGLYHTFTLEPAVEFTIQKEKWLRFQLDKLKEAQKQKDANVLVCVLDREKAMFAQLRNYGFEVMGEIKGNVQKKDSPEKVKSTFYKDIVKMLKEYDMRNNYSKIVVASPAFWKEYLHEALTDDPLGKKVLTASCNSIDIDGINEVLRRPEVMTALKEDRVVQEINKVEELLVEIKKDGNAVWGPKETKSAVNAGAVKTLLISDVLILKAREDGSYGQIDHMMRTVDSMKGEIDIISAEHDGGKKLEGLGGIGAILRYKL